MEMEAVAETALLVLNAGSSSIRFTLFPGDRPPAAHGFVCKGHFEGIGHEVHFTARDSASIVLADERFPAGMMHEAMLQRLLAWLGHRFGRRRLVAAGHRIVHGGSGHTKPVLLDPAIVAGLRDLVPLAPLHQPHQLAAIDALSALHAALPQVGCFDTSFHLTQSPVAAAFALPRRLSEEGVRRYGFHGLSYEYVASVLPEIVGPELADGRIVVAHLGSGASLCAIKERRSVATTMGFTPLDGLPMGSRCGALDPGAVLYLLQQKGMTADQVADLLYHRSGLLGVSGISDDMKVLLESRDPRAAESIDLFVYRVGRELGSLAAALGGLDALVFTAGIGELAPAIRRKICEQAGWLGVALDARANDAGGPRISAESAKVSAWVVPTDEDLMVARHTWAATRERFTTPTSTGRVAVAG